MAITHELHGSYTLSSLQNFSFITAAVLSLFRGRERETFFFLREKFSTIETKLSTLTLSTTWKEFEQTLVLPTNGGFRWNSVKIGCMVSKKKSLKWGTDGGTEVPTNVYLCRYTLANSSTQDFMWLATQNLILTTWVLFLRVVLTNVCLHG